MRVLIVARPNVSFSLRAGKALMIPSYWSKASNASARPSASDSAAMTCKMIEDMPVIWELVYMYACIHVHMCLPRWQVTAVEIELIFQSEDLRPNSGLHGQ